jgi:hypothetical protein
MSNELNDRLRAALRPVDPGERFTQSVLARIASEPAASRPTVRPMRNASLPWLSATALATLVALGLMIEHQHKAQHVEAGLEARRQVMEALRVTSEKLDVAYRVVKDKDLPGTEKRGA